MRSDRVAPSALRSPISRMRSVTVVSIMFMIPMPPTTSEIPAIDPSSTVSVLVTVDSVDAISAWFMIRKSASAESAMPCRASRSASMSASTCVIASCDAAST